MVSLAVLAGEVAVLVVRVRERPRPGKIRPWSKQARRQPLTGGTPHRPAERSLVRWRVRWFEFIPGGPARGSRTGCSSAAAAPSGPAKAVVAGLAKRAVDLTDRAGGR